MAIEQDILELIHADIDGEISGGDRERLQAHLQSNPEAQRKHDEVAELCQALDGIEERAPPAHLKHLVLDALPAVKAREPKREIPFWKSLLVAPPLHYVGTFAAGSLVTFLIISSNQIQEGAFNGVTDLVGTMSSDIDAGPADTTINITDQMLAGTIKAHRSGPILVIDFDLMSMQSVEIIATFTDPDVWFNGFAQLESEGTSVSAETGKVTLRMSGKRRYAMYLHNASASSATVDLQFIAGGRTIHEDSLTFRGSR
ncbi:MAG: zf-HC2 domain-containing protein [Gammaproteobacteria bacterium]|nr:zf-HC2 domain-containing protein [Gammaproteobacteria bacterium]